MNNQLQLAFHFTVESCRSLVDYCDVLSAVWTLILTAPIHCRGSIGEQVMKCYISPKIFWSWNELIYVLGGLRVSKIKANFHFRYYYIDG